MSPDEHVRQDDGLDPGQPGNAAAATGPGRRRLLGFPRHLSQHVGGLVLAHGGCDELVPIGNAAMADRTFIESDKDDIDRSGLMKVDVLALGMLSALRKSFAMLPPLEDGTVITDSCARLRHVRLEEAQVITGIAHVPQEVPEVYDMLCKANLGVFRSRAGPR